MNRAASWSGLRALLIARLETLAADLARAETRQELVKVAHDSGLTLQEIAELLGIRSRSVVHGILHGGRQR